jgi:hypothetical protein
MDQSISDILLEGEKILEIIQKDGVLMNAQNMERHINDIQKKIKILQVVSRRLADISNIASQYLSYRNSETKKSCVIDPFPLPGEHTMLFNKVNKEKKEILPQISINVKNIDSVDEIVPNITLYYLKSRNEFVTSINGHVISGNMGNITQYESKNTAVCVHGVSCKNLIKYKQCQYYHPNSDWATFGLEPPTNNYRNFTVGSWIYCREKKRKTYFRHIGSRDNLLTDLSKMKQRDYKTELQTRESQLMHDILVYLCMQSYGLSTKFCDWSII